MFVSVHMCTLVRVVTRPCHDCVTWVLQTNVCDGQICTMLTPRFGCFHVRFWTTDFDGNRIVPAHHVSHMYSACDRSIGDSICYCYMGEGLCLRCTSLSWFLLCQVYSLQNSPPVWLKLEFSYIKIQHTVIVVGVSFLLCALWLQ